MRNILLLFARYGSHILFWGLEIFCFFLIVNYNKTQKDIYLNSIHLFSGEINQKLDNIRDYISLREFNERLSNENASLIQEALNMPWSKSNNPDKDSIFQYRVIPASVCNKTINLKNNYFTLCKGSRSGIGKGMGVIAEDGIVGQVKSVSENFAIVLPLINVLSRTSVAIKHRNYFGTMLWKSSHPQQMTVEDIPKHADIAVGDTIMTSGFSSIFPRGINIGRITNFSVEPGSANYTIEVETDRDLSNLEFVYVIDYLFRYEKDSLQNSLLNE